MKLSQIFETKKEVKDRNPVAKELRQNPQYKAKTEIDKKKEVKKGYQKHKGKMEEATIKPYISMYKDEKDGKQVYDVLDKNEKSAFKTKDYDKAKEYFKQNFDKLKELKEDEATSQRYAAAWRKENPIGSNWLNPDDYDADSEGEHYITNTRTEMDIFKVPAKNYDEAFDKWLDGGSSSEPKDNIYYDSTKDYASDHQYWGRKAPEQEDDEDLEDSVQHTSEAGYQGEVEPTSHTFKKADLDKVKNTIKSKGMSADAEKTDGGVKVHTYDKDRSSIAKALGIDEAIPAAVGAVARALVAPGIKGKLSRAAANTAIDKMTDSMDNHGDESRDVATDLWADMPNFEKEKFGGNNEEGFENFLKSDDFRDHLDHLRSKFEDKMQPDPELTADDMEDEDLPAFLKQYKKKTAELDRMRKLAGMSTASASDMNEDYQKMVRDVILKLIKKGMSDDEIQDRTGEAGERIKIIRQNAEKEMNEYDGPDETIDGSFTDKQIKQAFGVLNDPRFKQGNYDGAVAVINKIAPGLSDHPSVANALKRANEATQDIAQQTQATSATQTTAQPQGQQPQGQQPQDMAKKLNPLKSVIKTRTSSQQAAKGLDAMGKGEIVPPAQRGAASDFVNTATKVMTDPKTAMQYRNLVKKVSQ
tara:strand:+ start:9050 stop:10978 length:1929 start_codon:yes stop_codon:yes gene_type:complete